MTTECTLSGCTNEIEHDPKAKRPRVFCSNACRQKAYRQRQRSDRNVTSTSYNQVTTALDTFTQTQLETLRSRIDELLGSKMPALLYMRKGKGVTHMGVNRNVTFCGRDASGMDEVGNEQVQKCCIRCQKTRDDKSWWIGWREAFENDSDV